MKLQVFVRLLEVNCTQFKQTHNVVKFEDSLLIRSDVGAGDRINFVTVLVTGHQVQV